MRCLAKRVLSLCRAPNFRGTIHIYITDYQLFMAIYIHIPFCKQACYYCDFHFSVNTSYRERMVKAICQELEMQMHYFSGDYVSDSIYFGGGTPSILPISDLEIILETIYKYYKISDRAEITLEGNPDDLNLGKIQNLYQLGINRLSIGIQSFQDDFLRFMNRAHSSKEALQVVENIRKVGFENFTIDLIYGIPAQHHRAWKADLAQTLKLCPPHISAYCLTIEPKTVFGYQLEKGVFSEASDEFSARQFDFLVEKLTQNQYDAYEISNFAQPNFYARHNSNYWKRGIYLGIGAGAHSYDGASRQSNIANNHQYMKAIEAHEIPAEKEILTRENHINEYLMTGLRTKWGCDITILEKYNFDILKERHQELQKYIHLNQLEITAQHLKLTQKGKFLADEIMANLFV